MTIHEKPLTATVNASLSYLECITPFTEKRAVNLFDSSGALHSSGERRWLDSSSFSATLSRRNSIATDEPPRLPSRGTDSSEPVTSGKAFPEVPLPSVIDVPVRFVSISPHHQRNVSQLSVPSLSTVDELESVASEKGENLAVLHSRIFSTSSIPFLGNLILDTDDELTYSDVDEKSFVSSSVLCQLGLETGHG